MLEMPTTSSFPETSKPKYTYLKPRMIWAWSHKEHHTGIFSRLFFCEITRMIYFYFPEVSSIVRVAKKLLQNEQELINELYYVT